MGDFRTSAWSLRDAHAPEGTLAELEARPMRATNAETLRVFEVRLDPAAERKVGVELLELGFRYLGTSAESMHGHSIPCDAFIDQDEAVHVVVRHKSSILLRASRYYILTYFDDGSCVETFGAAKPAYGSSDALIVRAGHDDLARDVAEHLACVRERATRGAKVLSVRSLDDVARLKRFYVSHVITESLASAMLNAKVVKGQLLRLAVSFVVVVALFLFLILTR